MRVLGRQKTSKAFALPTVLIASIVLLTILAVSVSATAAVRTTLKNQYYTQLAQIAGESGVSYAKACLAVNGNIPQWTDAKPLTPATDCAGTVKLSCPSDSKCFVMTNDNVRSSFSVPKPAVDGSTGQAQTIANSGYVEVVRTTTGLVWRTFKQPSVQPAVVPDLCSGNATASRGWSAAVKMTQQDALPSASSAQTIGLADGAVNAGLMYFRRDFNIGLAASYDMNVYTSSNQDSAVTYIDGQLISTAAGALSATPVALATGCHTIVVQLTNLTTAARPSDFTASLTRSGAAAPVVVTNSSWRVTAGDPAHFSDNNYYEAPNQWEPVANIGTWSDTSGRWGGGPANWSAVSGDALSQWISSQGYSQGAVAPPSSYTLLRDSVPFVLTATSTVRITDSCDDTCDLYLDGTLVLSNTTYSVPTSKSITIQAGTHTFGARLRNGGSSPGAAGFLFAAINLSNNNDVLSRSNVDWDVNNFWSTTAYDSYSYDTTYVPTPEVLPATNARVLVVGGGGAGGGSTGGGGGAGGVIDVAAYSLTRGSYAVVVGSGAPGTSQQTQGASGSISSFGTLVAYGGGGGGASAPSVAGSGGTGGGSGGGGQNYTGANLPPGPGVQSQGNNGGYTISGNSAGGGGAGGAGGAGSSAPTGGSGGVGVQSNITGSMLYYGGGGGGSYNGPAGNGGGGAGGPNTTAGTAGTANTGGGGGGGWSHTGGIGGAGGSGVVIISYPTASLSASGGSKTSSGSNTIHRFTTSGTFTVN